MVVLSRWDHRTSYSSTAARNWVDYVRLVDKVTTQHVYYQRVDGVAAFILAGGKSSRMGKDKDKAFLRLGGQMLLAGAFTRAGTVAADVYIVGDAQKFLPYGPVVEDIYPGQGPLAGIHAALMSSRADLNLMLAVDMPIVEPGFLNYLLSAARESRALVTVPHTEGRWQPLCAVYRRNFAVVAEQALREGKNRIDALFAQVETRVIAEEELSRMGFSSDMFRNLNTPAEFESAERAMQASGKNERVDE
jgi:molybdopterin-guanine dinucleotide biosynthesis protein A